ncbi:hypothetical protein MKQ68_14805 [Chitinophaga horti]|uniref:DUF4468 domain-containing protein n=1 Tax=Chitinophaga horti TaxID=2920382 RepID=A0ABY6IYZ8_9BACT|nr:hypothetical protein [Chitinophaga horti]UYQ91361.1 hypothetical protein MKQ68_14805 [Chitinophaga horti]
MNKYLKAPKLLLLAIMLAPQLLMAQKIKVVSGDVAAFKNIDTFNTVFTYNNLKVGKEGDEKNYIDRKKADYNKKEAGKGDAWEKAWKEDRSSRYEPKFNELFSKTSEHAAGDFKTARYTLLVNTTFIEPGFNVGIHRERARVDTEITLVETANPTKELVKFTVDDTPGGDVFGFDYDSGVRISEAYALTGKALAKYISKKIN